MKRLLIGSVLSGCCLALIAADNKPPSWNGLNCMGWMKPEAKALVDGDSTGELLVVNTPLTEDQKLRLYRVRQRTEAALKEEHAVEESILASQNLLFPLQKVSEWMRLGPCGDTAMIRSGEYHITQFVPSNPAYPGNNSSGLDMYFAEKSAAWCRGYFAEQRKRAVKATYGWNDTYKPYDSQEPTK